MTPKNTDAEDNEEPKMWDVMVESRGGEYEGTVTAIAVPAESAKAALDVAHDFVEGPCWWVLYDEEPTVNHQYP